HAAVERLGTFIPKVTANHTKHAWYAHLDVRSFFPSIDHARSAPTPSSAGRRTFDELDQYIKHELKVRFYLRYVDDLVLLSTSREDLLAWRAAIDAFLRRRLHLELNAERSRIAPLSSGIDFLGYINHPHHRLVRRRVVGNLRSRLSDLQKRLTREERDSSWILYREGESEYLRDMVASYRAHFLHADSARLRARIRSRFPWLRRALPGTGKKPFWFAPRAFPCLGAQVHWFEDRYPESLIAFQVGRFWEFYGAWAARVAEAAHLKLYRGA
ncbi:MAG: hypothetical protein JXP34_08820, partial [Planctomycetes bacterium]|nr:hypothetical protein [Planctomycetota bacterium]